MWSIGGNRRAQYESAGLRTRKHPIANEDL